MGLGMIILIRSHSSLTATRRRLGEIVKITATCVTAGQGRAWRAVKVVAEAVCEGLSTTKFVDASQAAQLAFASALVISVIHFDVFLRITAGLVLPPE